MGGWEARHNNHHQWIQFDLGRIYKITMLSTQGRKIVKQWVTRYTLAQSVDCVHFVPYKQRDRLKYFVGNYDGASIVTRTLTPPMAARFVRVHPRGWYRHISMKVELHGCTPERCDIPLGSEDSRLPDVAFTASSIYNAAYQGRLNAMRSGYLFVTSCEQLSLPCMVNNFKRFGTCPRALSRAFAVFPRLHREDLHNKPP